MKKTLLSIVYIILFINGLLAQNDKLNWIGLNTSLSKGELIRYSGTLDGGGSYSGQKGYLIGLGFVRTLNDKLDIESGIDYSRNKFSSSYINEIGQVIKSADPTYIDLITIPLNIRIKLKKLFFISSGAQYTQHTNFRKSQNIDNQTGIGINFKFGKDFILSNNTCLYIAPEILIHNLAPFYPEKNQRRLTEFGIRLSYKFRL